MGWFKIDCKSHGRESQVSDAAAQGILAVTKMGMTFQLLRCGIFEAAHQQGPDSMG